MGKHVIKKLTRLVVDESGRPAREGRLLVLDEGDQLSAAEAAKLGLAKAEPKPKAAKKKEA
ncbi:MAG: hypothetical protein ACRELC_07700 [Gemmatimonadota bacterium]